MGDSLGNAYSGNKMTDAVSGAFGSALNGSQNMTNFGSTALANGFNIGTNAANGFKNAGTVADTDLSKYMNPFTKDVIDTSMNELTRQRNLGMLNVQDAAVKAGAFGGDREAIQKAAMDRDFLNTKATTLANLNSANFTNAQNQAQGDINNRLAAATGQGNVAQGFGTTGTNLMTNGISGLGNTANMGFGWGQTLSDKADSQGAAAQAMVQKILDAAKSQFSGFANQGSTGLSELLRSILTPPGGTGSTTESSNPGILGILGGILSLAGSA